MDPLKIDPPEKLGFDLWTQKIGYGFKIPKTFWGNLKEALEVETSLIFREQILN